MHFFCCQIILSKQLVTQWFLFLVHLQDQGCSREARQLFAGTLPHVDIYLSIYLSIYLFIYLSIYLSIYLFRQLWNVPESPRGRQPSPPQHRCTAVWGFVINPDRKEGNYIYESNKFEIEILVYDLSFLK